MTRPSNLKMFRDYSRKWVKELKMKDERSREPTPQHLRLSSCRLKKKWNCSKRRQRLRK